jgi:hypothetical protein
MKFGTIVLVHRGSSGNPPGTPGCKRTVRGVLVGARGANRRVRLLKSDPLSALGYCTRAGDIGWWARSQVKAAK